MISSDFLGRCRPNFHDAPEIHQQIDKAKAGQDICLMGHHYMSDAVIAHVDKVGDSLELARMMDTENAAHILFCGVHFMAETAALLAKPGQSVYLPAPNADCVMARMTPAPLLDEVLTRLKKGGRKLIPLAYVNTTLAVKAVVGRHGGAVCTSANAKAMLEWALGEGDGVLFLPDGNLGNNAADLWNLPQKARYTLNVQHKGQRLDMKAAGNAELLLWPGCCAIHAMLKPEMAMAMRREHPKARILVHPESSPELVRECDGAGSTSYLIKQAAEALPGAELIIGTEWNLVNRLALRHPECLILPLAHVACSNMDKVRPQNLLAAITAIGKKTCTAVTVDEQMKSPAKEALARMLAIR